MAQELLAYLSSEVREEDVAALRELVEALSKAGEWTLGAPRFVDELDDSSCTRPEDEPIRTTGVVLTVSSPRELPETPVAEPERLLVALSQLSRARGFDMEVQLDNTYTGEIRHGSMDRLLREGLLDKWS